jgi:hypothetical protein
MEFAQNMFNSRSGEPDDQFERMASELELDDFEQSNLDQYTNIETSAKVGNKPAAKRCKYNPRSPARDSFWWQEWLAPAKAQPDSRSQKRQ